LLLERYLLLLSIRLENSDRLTAAGGGKLRWGPQNAFPIGLSKIRPFLSEHSARDTLETIDQRGHGMLRRVVDQQMHMGVFAVRAGKGGFKVRTDLSSSPSFPDPSVTGV
jgi:hypothetical protein